MVMACDCKMFWLETYGLILCAICNVVKLMVCMLSGASKGMLGISKPDKLDISSTVAGIFQAQWVEAWSLVLCISQLPRPDLCVFVKRTKLGYCTNFK